MPNPRPDSEVNKKHQNSKQRAKKIVAHGFKRIELVEFENVFEITEPSRIYFVVKRTLPRTSGNRWA